jgi:hypothetical protein
MRVDVTRLQDKERGMLEEIMHIYSRGPTDWPSDIFKNTGRNFYRGRGRKGMRRHRNKIPNMLHVSKKTKLKHRRALKR